jgi:DNA-binding NtrC family response regulator
MDGIELLRAIKLRDPQIPVIVFSGHGNIDTAVAAIGHGAADFIEKPFEALTKVRYKDAGTFSLIEQHENRMMVNFYSNVKGIAPGQSAVFYDGNDVIGGGWIQSSFDL